MIKKNKIRGQNILIIGGAGFSVQWEIEIDEKASNKESTALHLFTE